MEVMILFMYFHRIKLHLILFPPLSPFVSFPCSFQTPNISLTMVVGLGGSYLSNKKIELIFAGLVLWDIGCGQWTNNIFFWIGTLVVCFILECI